MEKATRGRSVGRNTSLGPEVEVIVVMRVRKIVTYESEGVTGSADYRRPRAAEEEKACNRLPEIQIPGVNIGY